MRLYSLGGVRLVVHEEEIDIADVVDEEGLVTGGHHVAGLLVVAVADLHAQTVSLQILAHLLQCLNAQTHPPGAPLSRAQSPRLSPPPAALVKIRIRVPWA